MIESMLEKEKFKKLELENGLKIITYTDSNFESTYCNYTINYGSVDYTYLKNNKKVIHTPGIAHFLEHVMFNTIEGDAFDQFSEKLASANAYTTYERTSYLFSAKENLEENVLILLDLVNQFVLSKEQIEKEKGIINAEIDMYDKDLNYEIYQVNMENSLENSKYSNQILGTKNDINNIDIEQLSEAFSDFYSPDNSVLTLVGPDLEYLIEVIKNYFLNNPKKKQFDHINRIINHNSFTKKISTAPIVISRNNALQNYCATSYYYQFTKKLSVEEINLYKLLVHMILEQQWSPINVDYNKLIEKEIIDYQFETDVQVNDDFILISYYYNLENLGKRKDIEQIIDQNLIELNKVTEKEFSAMINQKIGRVIKRTLDPQKIGELSVHLQRYEQSIIEYLEFLKNLKFIEIENFLQIIKKMKKSKKATIITN